MSRITKKDVLYEEFVQSVAALQKIYKAYATRRYVGGSECCTRCGESEFVEQTEFVALAYRYKVRGGGLAVSDSGKRLTFKYIRCKNCDAREPWHLLRVVQNMGPIPSRPPRHRGRPSAP